MLYSRALSGMEAALVTVEVHIANGLPNFTIVGLPETEVKESKDRVRAALQNCQFDFPALASPSTWLPPICPRKAGDSIYPSHSAYSPPPDKSPPTNSLNMNMPENLR